jgi:Ca2+-binding RTX toxin-like protein
MALVYTTDLNTGFNSDHLFGIGEVVSTGSSSALPGIFQVYTNGGTRYVHLTGFTLGSFSSFTGPMTKIAIQSGPSIGAVLEFTTPRIASWSSGSGSYVFGQTLTAANTPSVPATLLADHDIFTGSNMDDVLRSYGGHDLLDGGAGDDILDAGSGHDIVNGGSGHDTLEGGGGYDALTGGEGNDSLDGGTGLDEMVGGAGNDIYSLDSSGDLVMEFLGEGQDEVRVSFSGYVLPEHVEVLQLTGAAVSGAGNGGENTLIGTAGANILDGGSGADILQGLGGDDTYVVDDASDVVDETGGTGTDTVLSAVTFSLASAADAIGAVERLTLTGAGAVNGTGNALRDVLTGNSSANILVGLAGDDALSGGGGKDMLVGGLGRDVLKGDAGADRFDFDNVNESSVGARRDVVTFVRTEGDKMDLSTIDAKSRLAKNQAFAWVDKADLDAVFNGTAGQLRFASGILSGDVNGDKRPDFEIRIVGALTAGDVIL